MVTAPPTLEALEVSTPAVDIFIACPIKELEVTFPVIFVSPDPVTELERVPPRNVKSPSLETVLVILFACILASPLLPIDKTALTIAESDITREPELTLTAA